MKITVVRLGLAALLAATMLTANAADIYVTNYATIQAAVNAAASGDTIQIAPGVYAEQTWISNKNLALVGQPGAILRAFPGIDFTDESAPESRAFYRALPVQFSTNPNPIP